MKAFPISKMFDVQMLDDNRWKETLAAGSSGEGLAEYNRPEDH